MSKDDYIRALGEHTLDEVLDLSIMAGGDGVVVKKILLAQGGWEFTELETILVQGKFGQSMADICHENSDIDEIVVRLLSAWYVRDIEGNRKGLFRLVSFLSLEIIDGRCDGSGRGRHDQK